MLRCARIYLLISYLLLLFLAVGDLASAGSRPSKPYRDRVHKFSLMVFPEWEQVPPEAGQNTTVLNFYDPANKGDMWPPSLEVVRIPKGDNALSSLTGFNIDDLPEETREKLLESLRQSTAWDYTMARLRVPKGNEPPDQERFRKIKSRDKVSGKLWTTSICFRKGDRNATLFATLIAFEKDDVEYGLFMKCTDLRREDYEKQFRKIGESFRFFDEKAKEVQTLDVLKDVNISPKRKREIEEGLVKGWDIHVSPKKNYIVLYNTNEKKNKKLAKVIGEQIEKIREQIYEKQFPSAKPIDAVSVVRVCKGKDEYIQYGGSPSSAGYWYWPSQELVFFDASPAKKIDHDTVSVLYHEAFHQYIFYSVGNVSPHSWFNEGHGDYYSGHELKGRRFVTKPFRWRIDLIKAAIRQGPRDFELVTDEKTQKEYKRWDNEPKGYTPLADLLRFTQREYYSYSAICYAQGWSLVYFLREEAPKKKYPERWGKILDIYFDTLKEEVNPTRPNEDDAEAPGEKKEEEEAEPPRRFDNRKALEKALEKAFEGVDIEELEKAWIKSTLSVKR